MYKEFKVGTQQLSSIAYARGRLFYVSRDQLYTTNGHDPPRKVMEGVRSVGVIGNNLICIGSKGIYRLDLADPSEIKRIGNGVDIPQGFTVVRECDRLILVSVLNRNEHLIIDPFKGVIDKAVCTCVYGTINVNGEGFVIKGSHNGLRVVKCTDSTEADFIKLRAPYLRRVWAHMNHVSAYFPGRDFIELLVVLTNSKDKKRIIVDGHVFKARGTLIPVFGTALENDVLKAIIYANGVLLLIKYHLVTNSASFYTKELSSEVAIFPSGRYLLALSNSNTCSRVHVFR